MYHSTLRLFFFSGLPASEGGTAFGVSRYNILSGMGVRGSLSSRVYCTLDRMKEKISGTIIQQVLNTKLRHRWTIKRKKEKET